jgi:hypothetical protein
MALETLATRALTEAYIDLAAAKAAASLGITAGPSITAAASTKAALTGLLGFDDPRNDAIAYRHGADYADQFMLGMQSRWGAPGFGKSVRDALPVAPAGAPVSATSPNTTVIQVQGSLITQDELVRNVIVPSTERMIDYNNSLITKRQPLRTGTRI